MNRCKNSIHPLAIVAIALVDEPTTGLDPADVDRLMAQLDGLVEAGNTLIVVEHEMRVVAQSDWVIDVGPGAGQDVGRIVAEGTPQQVAQTSTGRTAPYLAECLAAAGSRSHAS